MASKNKTTKGSASTHVSDDREYYLKNRQRILARIKNRRRKDPEYAEHLRARQRAYYARNREKVLARQNNLTPEQRERQLAYFRAYYQANRAKLLARANARNRVSTQKRGAK